MYDRHEMGPHEQKCVPFDPQWRLFWYNLIPILSELMVTVKKNQSRWRAGYGVRVVKGQKHSSVSVIEHNKGSALIFGVFLMLLLKGIFL